MLSSNLSCPSYPWSFYTQVETLWKKNFRRAYNKTHDWIKEQEKTMYSEEFLGGCYIYT